MTLNMTDADSSTIDPDCDLVTMTPVFVGMDAPHGLFFVPCQHAAGAAHRRYGGARPSDNATRGRRVVGHLEG